MTHKHNLRSNKAKKTGDCSSDTRVHLPWRQFGRFLAAVALSGFVLNEIWEMAQMPSYVETAGIPWSSTLALCTHAAIGDVMIIFGIYMTGALAAGDLIWGLRGRWNTYAIVALIGLVYAVLVEHAALAGRQWSYTERMPIVSVLRAGLWPLLQMTLLPPLSFVFARWWASRGAFRSLQ